MSGVLSRMLNESEIVLGSAVGKLEELSGFESRDLRLLDEKSAQIRQKTADLGLDPQDTTPRELYFALQDRFMKDCHLIRSFYQNNSSEKQLKQIAKTVQLSQANREVWVLKHSAAKALLKADLPKVLMRRLGYRSADSLLKHEDTALILAALSQMASRRWLEGFEHQLSKLTPLDFETKKLSLVVPNTKKWKETSADFQLLSLVPQHGSVVLWPNESALNAEPLVVLTLLFQAFENIYKNNLVVKSQQTAKDFGSRIQRTWSNAQPHIATIAGIELQWRTLFNHLSGQPPQTYPEAFDPHILPEHLSGRSISQILAAIHPHLNWWKDNDALVFGKGKNQTSLNIIDVALNFAGHTEFGQNTKQVGRTALWDEVLSRYMEHPNVLGRVIDEIEANSTSLATVRVEAGT